uniref:Uncharacterized protein n=1 Tax=Rhizophora mucronata TaxID=61149 RepID=A0A2P2LP46_RHIMU
MQSIADLADQDCKGN